MVPKEMTSFDYTQRFQMVLWTFSLQISNLFRFSASPRRSERGETQVHHWSNYNNVIVRMAQNPSLRISRQSNRDQPFFRENWKWIWSAVTYRLIEDWNWYNHWLTFLEEASFKGIRNSDSESLCSSTAHFCNWQPSDYHPCGVGGKVLPQTLLQTLKAIPFLCVGNCPADTMLSKHCIAPFWCPSIASVWKT